MNLETIIQELLPDQKIRSFSLDWSSHSNTTREHTKEVYAFLKQLGLKDDKIASRAELLGRDPKTIQRNYDVLNN